MHPRVLLVTSSAFNPYSGGGITLTNLFRGWPAERIATVHGDSLPPDESVCQKFYRLTPSELGWIWPLSLVSPRTSSAAGGAETGARRSQASLVRSARAALATVVCEAALQDRARVSAALGRWVEAFRPELLYTFLGSLGFVRLVSELARRSGAPVVVHMMDDWPETRYRRGIGSRRRRRQLEPELAEILGAAAARLSISEPMARAFEDRYRVPFRAFHNALDLDRWRAHRRSDWRRREKLQILYSGSIEPAAQLQSLRDVARAVGELASEGEPVELVIRSPRHALEACRDPLGDSPAVKLDQAPDEAAIAQVLSGADVLLLPVNFDRETVDYVRYSFPTKIPAYLASGSPVLAYGPAEVTQIQLAREQGWALVVDRRDPLALKQAIRDLALDEKLRERLGRRGFEIASSEHDASRVRPAFQAVLAEAARRGPA
jgi:glycosyltransferase involved in cell wall biosynthesis